MIQPFRELYLTFSHTTLHGPFQLIAAPKTTYLERPDNADAQGHESSSTYLALKGRAKLCKVVKPSVRLAHNAKRSLSLHFERLEILLRYFQVSIEVRNRVRSLSSEKIQRYDDVLIF